ncbi:hypothetical protein [Actinocatenispora comari]|uniref:Uncharacterized protein n=1 Tax=Actinocatenispora comari TaxID=2807577 RepID=A0A8J4AGB1_9ACTN|nr:hypothetical protein [Actinocatenispora comari]GIL29142.1 hypothetical protein NUM_43960 [Actinocatenispora comari]
MDAATGAWRSIDGAWRVRAIHDDANGGGGEQFYRITHDGKHIADLDDFAQLARWVPLHLLVDDEP